MVVVMRQQMVSFPLMSGLLFLDLQIAQIHYHAVSLETIVLM